MAEAAAATLRTPSRPPSPSPSAGAQPQVHAAPATTSGQRPTREVFGFADAGSLGDPSVGYQSWDFSLLSTVAFFGLSVAPTGDLIRSGVGWSEWNSADLTAMRNRASAAGGQTVLTIILQSSDANTTAQNNDLFCKALTNYATTVAQTVTEVQQKGVAGVNIDYEWAQAQCPDGQWLDAKLVNLARSLKASLPAGQNYLSIDTYAGSAEGGGTGGLYNLPALNQYVDSFFVMEYALEYSNWRSLGCSTFCLSPTSPLDGYRYNDRLSNTQYAQLVGGSKVIMGVPYYGDKACVANLTDPNQVSTGNYATSGYLYNTGIPGQSGVSQYVAHRESISSGLERWDTYHFQDNSPPPLNCNRELYWDDAVSLGRKYDLVATQGLRGVGLWNLNLGGGSPELWNSLAAHFTTRPTAPTSVTACATANAAYVSWVASPGGAAISSYTVTATPGGATVTVLGTQTGAQLSGLTAGTTYTFTVQAMNGSGSSPNSTASNAVTPAAANTSTQYFTWYDRASPGMANDNVHLVNPGPGAASGCVYISGVAVQPFSLGANATTYAGFPGLIGGPVVVTTTTGTTIAAQRVQYNQSFNEVPAGATPQATLWFPWYDHASPGMTADNIHVVNPGASTATVVVTGPGDPQTLTVLPGSEAIASWPPGVIGGPVKLTTSTATPVFASQRVQYVDTFNETLARTTQDQGPDLVFNWYDHASPGMWNDNVHLVNPQSTAVQATVSAAGAAQTVTVPAGGTYIVNLGNVIGGPLKVHSALPLIASQRVQYYSSFNEVGGTPATAASPSIWMPWYDSASPGMVTDNVHVVNPGTSPVSISVDTPAGTQTFVLAPGAEGYASWPGTMGGPVHVHSTGGAVIASQRVQFFQTFNEAIGIAG